MQNVNRRQILRGLSLGAGSLVLGPVVAQLEAHAAGQTPRPKRFVFVLEGNGVNPEQVQPAGIPRKKQQDRDTLIDCPLADHQLPFALEPLAPFKSRLAIIQGLSGRVCGGGHSNNYGALGCFNARGTAGSSGAPSGETIDAALAKALPGIFPHVGLGITDRPEHGIVYNCSAWAAGKPLPTQCRPDLAYNTLFGSVAEGSGQQAFAAQGNLLDFLSEDVKRLRGGLAAPERERLEHYLGAYEALRDRRSRLNEIQHTLRKAVPVASDKFKSDVETDRLDAHFDIGAAALVGGLTNVLTLASGVGDPYFSVRFHGLGISLDKHSIGHGQSYNGKPWAELSSTIRRFHMEQIARLAAKLQAVPEGDGTMLDNTLIVYLSDAAEGHHSRCWEWPVVVLGNLGGRLKTGGRYLEYPYHGRKGHRTVSNLYTTFLHAAGAPRDRFGLEDPTLKHLDQKGPLSELLA